MSSLVLLEGPRTPGKDAGRQTEGHEEEEKQDDENHKHNKEGEHQQPKPSEETPKSVDFQQPKEEEEGKKDSNPSKEVSIARNALFDCKSLRY